MTRDKESTPEGKPDEAQEALEAMATLADDFGLPLGATVAQIASHARYLQQERDRLLLSETVPSPQERMEQIHQAFDEWLKKADPHNLFATSHGFAREAWQDALLNAAPQADTPASPDEAQRTAGTTPSGTMPEGRRLPADSRSAVAAFSSDKEQTFSPRRELLILMQKESNGATRIRVEDQRDGSLLVERTAFGFEEALFARLQEAKEVSSATLPHDVVSGLGDIINYAHKPDFVAKAAREIMSRYVKVLSPKDK